MKRRIIKSENDSNHNDETRYFFFFHYYCHYKQLAKLTFNMFYQKHTISFGKKFITLTFLLGKMNFSLSQ